MYLFSCSSMACRIGCHGLEGLFLGVCTMSFDQNDNLWVLAAADISVVISSCCILPGLPNDQHPEKLFQPMHVLDLDPSLISAQLWPLLRNLSWLLWKQTYIACEIWLRDHCCNVLDASSCIMSNLRSYVAWIWCSSQSILDFSSFNSGKLSVHLNNYIASVNEFGAL